MGFDQIDKKNLVGFDQIGKKNLVGFDQIGKKNIDPAGKAATLFDAIPGQLSKNESRYKASSVISSTKTERIEELVKTMRDTMTVNVAYHSSDPNVGLALTRDNGLFKLFVGDTGLFVTLAFKDKKTTENDIYNKLLNDKLSTNLGYVYENVIAQMLRAAGKEIYYHTIPFAEGKKYYEIDFVIADGHKITPIEVKSSGYRTHASLDEFCRKYSERIQNKYLIYTRQPLKINLLTMK